MHEDQLQRYDGEIFFYYGDISRHGYELISGGYELRENKKDTVCLILVTRGGDPDAAYRIARATNHHFKNVEILIPDICKSAGTLLCIGSKKLIFGDRGELGPLDIQLSKPDEMHESMSGLDIIQAINALQNQMLTSFRDYLIDIRLGSRIRTRTAAEIATKLADGLIAPIAARIDPLTLGEHQRAMQIAYEYGDRLNRMANSLCQDALVKLVSNYPSHGFVIDRKEASELFRCVSEPDEHTNPIYLWSRQIVESSPYPSYHQPFVLDVKSILSKDFGSENKEAKCEQQGADEKRSEKGGQNIDGKSELQGQGHEPNFSQACERGDGAGSAVRKRTR